MKTNKIFISILLTMLLLGCGIGDKLDRIADSIEDVSNAAVSLLDKINDISRLVDSKLESGEINQDLADLLDGRLSTLTELLESTMQNSGGYFFDRVDGSVDNAFMNLSKLLDQVQTGILENTLPNLINQISSQMQLQINSIAASTEDIIILASGEVMVVLDKTVNGIVLTFSVILLALTLIIFAIILLRRGRKLTGANLIGIALVGLFVVFFSLLIFSPKIRGNIISGFDFASKVNKRELNPKITGIVPETIVLGKTKNIYVYGNHLNMLKSFDVMLMQGNKQKFKFPEGTVIVATRNRIVLGNLDKKLNWTVPQYVQFKAETQFDSPQLQMPLQKIIEINDGIGNSMYANVQALPSPAATADLQLLRTNAISVRSGKANMAQMASFKNNLSVQKLGIEKSAKYLKLLNSFFLKRFTLAEGDYGLMVYEDSLRIESPQYVSILNPPPPVPKPDVFVMDMNWSGGLEPVAGETTALDITFGFKHPEQISGPFKAKITSVPVIAPIDITIPEGKISSACSNNRVVVTSRAFSLNNPGSYKFTCSVDENNMIEESAENNNLASKYLYVGEETFQVSISSLKYESLGFKGQISISVKCDASGYPTQSCSSVLTVTSKDMIPIDCHFQFANMKKGGLLNFSASSSTKISMPLVPDIEIDLGTIPLYTFDLDERPTDGLPSKDFKILRETKYYKLHGVLTVKKLR